MEQKKTDLNEKLSENKQFKSDGAMWKRISSKNGDTYYRIIIGSHAFRAFRNQFKKADNHPDYTIIEDKPREELEVKANPPR